MAERLGRRRFLWRGLAAVTALAAGGIALRAWNRGVFSVGQGPAYEPWRQWREARASGPLALVQAGILAANAHNTQPWRFSVSAERIAIHADPARNIGSFDPFRREMHLSLGCALENVLLAARALGFEANPETRPGPIQPVESGTPVIELRLSGPGPRQNSELFNAIEKRRTYRGPYDLARSIPAALQAELQNLSSATPELRLFFFTDDERRRLGDLIVATTEAIVGDKEMATDSASWFRFDWEAVRERRDGITLDAVGLPPFINAAAKILPPVSQEEADRTWLKDTRDVHVATSPLLGMIAVNDLYDRPTAVAAGRLWQRIHLWATARGLVAQPLSQPAEMVDRERQLGRSPRTAEALAKFTGDPNWRPTFVFRMGYSDRAPRLSPRRPLEDVLIKS